VPPDYQGVLEWQRELAAMYETLAELNPDPSTTRRVAREVMFSDAALGQYQHLGGALLDLRAQGGEAEAQCAAMAADLRAHVEQEQGGAWEPWQQELLEVRGRGVRWKVAQGVSSLKPLV
jgi:hypothetical protein